MYEAYMESLSPVSRISVAGRLKRAAAILGADPTTLPWYELSPAELEKVRDELLASGSGPSSVNSIVLAMRGAAAAGFSDEVLGHHWVESEEGWRRYDRLEDLREVKLAPVPPSTPKSRALRPHEFDSLLMACLSERTVAGVRDAAIVVASYVGGILAPELASLDTEDLEARPPALNLGRHSRSRERRVRLGRRAAGILAEWAAVRGRQPGKLFLHLDTWGNPTGKPMSALGVHWVLKSCSKKAGLERVSAPDLRHTAIKDLMHAGVGDLTILAIIGQSVDLAPYNDLPEGVDIERQVKGETPYHKWDEGLFSEDRPRIMRALGL